MVSYLVIKIAGSSYWKNYTYFKAYKIHPRYFWLSEEIIGVLIYMYVLASIYTYPKILGTIKLANIYSLL